MTGKAKRENVSPRITDAAADDADRLADVIRRASRDVAERFGVTAENCPKHPSHCTAEWVDAAMGKGVRFYVLESDGAACGCVALEPAKPNVCYLERLAVLPEFRRRGFGAALVRHALEQAKALGAGRVEIGIIAEHTELKSWYARLGFVVEREAVTFEHLPFKVTFMYCLLE